MKVCTTISISFEYRIDDSILFIRFKHYGTTTITSLVYGDGGDASAVQDASVTLDPDVTGKVYVDHSGLKGGDYSPGTYSDGGAFPGPDGQVLTQAGTRLSSGRFSL